MASTIADDNEVTRVISDNEEYVEEYIEEEVSGSEEEELDEELEVKDETPYNQGEEKLEQSGHAGTSTSKAPGKVSASKEVKSMKMRSPEHSKETPKQFTNPLTTRGVWNAKNFKDVGIIFPTLTSHNETTNDLTRKNRPESRYWKGSISFVHGSYRSETLVLHNIPVPFSDRSNYGTGYVYLCLPGFMAEAFAEAGKRKRPTMVTEKSLVPDSERWWKVANKVENKFGLAKKDTRGFKPIALPSAFASTQKGLVCNVELKFFCKASTTDLNQLTATVTQTVAVEIVRAYIAQPDVEVEMPDRVPRDKQEISPSFNDADYASDDVVKRFQALGLA